MKPEEIRKIRANRHHLMARSISSRKRTKRVNVTVALKKVIKATTNRCLIQPKLKTSCRKLATAAV